MNATVEDLRDRVEELETLLGLKVSFAKQFRFTRTEQKFVGILLRRKVASRDAFFTAIYGGLSDRSEGVIEVNISNIRRKLEPYGLTVRNRWGVGYYLDDKAREVLMEACG
jgi:DNA-binding response OmpR family regulator